MRGRGEGGRGRREMRREGRREGEGGARHDYLERSKAAITGTLHVLMSACQPFYRGAVVH